MRVGLSLLTLVPGVVGGSETYARSLCASLAAHGGVDAIAFVPSLAPDAAGGLPAEVVPGYRASRGTAVRLGAMALATLAPRSLGRRFDDLDVVHYPLTVPIPRVQSPTVLTLHDVQHLELPQLFPRGERLFRRLAYDRAARGATVVVTPSRFVRDRAAELLGLDPAAVVVSHHGVDHDRFRPGDGPREDILLYPARPWPHKNHARLLEAFALLRAERPELRLVLTGTGTEALAGPPGVEARGLVSGTELVDLYHRARCLVFPSLYEGFGAPPLEAMACGTPVAAARSASLPEVCGDAAVLFDPLDAKAIAAGVAEALDRAAELREAGLRHAAAFTWAAAAERHVEAYRAASTRS